MGVMHVYDVALFSLIHLKRINVYDLTTHPVFEHDTFR